MNKRIVSVLMAAALVLCAALPAMAQSGKLKVAFAMLGTVDDRGWNTAHANGIAYLKEKMGDKLDISITENVGPQDAERVIRNYAQQGYYIIFGNSFPHMDAMERVAAEYPNIKFEHCSGYKMADNMGNYFVRLYQAEYLTGYTVGLMGFKNVGTVATHPIPEPIRGINSFTLGLKKGLAEAGHDFDPKKVNTVVWMNSWADPIKETTLAETLAARGHDLIRQMADTPESSLAACAQGVPAVGYGTDAAAYGAQCVLTSTLINWGPYYVETIASVLDGTWKPRAYWGGFDKDGVRLAPFGAAVPADVQARVLAEMEKLQKGDDRIWAGPIVDQSGAVAIPEGAQATDGDLLGMTYFVEGVSGTIPK
ncbi:BMP family ABC transporter substrate-binding protein [Desulfovibrio psychrotolerans]|uniref:BMP family ABC transporter substrate-binding protein n=1 Tax=Desulfovibrio psychrotolerans TaxID=415242 RepID=A0A7J0BRG2_9BACT|nr:BMP family ABC transporter substrate-binding protein [Desulfovibrio psychrotolerans]GFM36260.1 BMP family ABC transporter substrate-binding protein [Desulfovibrio psychrotolerans]